MTTSISTATIALGGLQSVLEFPLVQALFGRRSRRFSSGTSIPDGPQIFTSRHKPLPLTELERMLAGAYLESYARYMALWHPD